MKSLTRLISKFDINFQVKLLKLLNDFTIVISGDFRNYFTPSEGLKFRDKSLIEFWIQILVLICLFYAAIFWRHSTCEKPDFIAKIVTIFKGKIQ